MELLMCDSYRFPAFRLVIFMLIAISQSSGFTIAARDKGLKQGLRAPDLIVGASDILPINLNNKFDNDKIIKSNDKNDTTMPLSGSKNNTQERKLTNVMSVSKSTRSEPKTVENKTLLGNKNYPSNSVIGEKYIKQTEEKGKDSTFVSVTASTNNTNSSDVKKQEAANEETTTSSHLNVPNIILQETNNTTPEIENKTKNFSDSKKLIDDKTHSTNSVLSDNKLVLESKTNLKGDPGVRAAKVNVSTILHPVNNDSLENTSEKFPRELIPWKKYKTIERKLTSTVPKEVDNIPAISATVEDIVPHGENIKKLEVSTIPDIRLDETTRSTLPIEMLLSSTEPMKLETTTNIITTEKNEIIKDKIMSSKRGGFLDLANPITDVNKAKSNENEKQLILENATQYPNAIKNAQLKSQILMNEADIRDELLMEKTMSEKEETANRYAEELKTNNGNEDSANNPPAETDDKNEGGDLRVQPIAKSLYEVNPNYKRMKKIDVVPAKPFVRDPDDNTWRNESLSSMGIVFKAKNSSKSFTEVIKSKTENELPNVLAEGDKSDQPALRDRLEQLAEMRKSKKKKPDNGDVLVDETEPTTGIVKVIENYSTTVKTVTVNPPSMKVVNAEKIKLEYFETPDDDTMEYYEAPLQRNTKKLMSSTEIPTLKPNMPYIDPNRKATVQYFPPKPETVSVNEYDTNFGNKMELFTDNSNNLKASKITKRPDTVSSTPIDDDYLDTYKKVYTSTHNALFRNHFFRPTQMSRPQSSSSYFVNNDNIHGTVEGFKVVMADVGKDDDDEVEHEQPQLRTYIPLKVAEPELNIIDKIIKGSQAVDLNMANKQNLHGFPILYNNSVVHTENSGKALASSTSFLRRDLDDVKPITRPKNILKITKKFDAIRDRYSVDITQPSYELHYFLPEHDHNEDA